MEQKSKRIVGELEPLCLRFTLNTSTLFSIYYLFMHRLLCGTISTAGQRRPHYTAAVLWQMRAPPSSYGSFLCRGSSHSRVIGHFISRSGRNLNKRKRCLLKFFAIIRICYFCFQCVFGDLIRIFGWAFL